MATVDLVGSNALAFVGRVTNTEHLRRTGAEDFDLRYEVVVDHAVKGVQDGDRVVMFGDTQGTSCGTQELQATGAPEVILSWSPSERFMGDATPACTRLPTVGEMLALDLTLPATSPGPVSLIADGRVGEAELISYDELGTPVAYGDLPNSRGRPAVCPGSTSMVQLEQPDRDVLPTLVVRDVATLQVRGRIELVAPEDENEPLSHHLTNGTIHCRDRDGLDVVVVLSWENSSDQRTAVVHIRPEEDGGTNIAMYRRASRAVYDAHTGSVVGVVDGELRRFSIDGGPIEPVAVLTNELDADHDAGLVQSDGQGGYWIAHGPVPPDRELVRNLTVLVHVGADGQTERWPIDGRMEPPYYSPMALVANSLVSGSLVVPLPALGSSAQGTTVTPEPRAEVNADWVLGDGRIVWALWTSLESVEVGEPSGERLTLQHLSRARHIVLVPDGPTVDPTQISRTPKITLLQSEWITDAAGNLRGASNSSGSPGTSWPWAALVFGPVAALAVLAWLARRRKNRTAEAT